MRLTTKSRLKPLGQRVLVIPIPDDETVSGSKIIRPQVSETKSTIGKVVAIGDGSQETSFSGEWPPIKVGDTILYGYHAGHELRLEDAQEREHPRIIGIDEVLAVVEKV